MVDIIETLPIPPPQKKRTLSKNNRYLRSYPPPPPRGRGRGSGHVLKTNIKQQIGPKTNITQYILYSLHNIK